ncbi:uncharacterized protein [Gossypium hirsutum]|uniref:Uncharacterized protein n=1 Tax=Gossypium hirsutum TaxID=3635 RepID=A0ABM3AT39_GOSHI|nr:uncharacterized protein LOC121222044 [Gossypium hirsutum]
MRREIVETSVVGRTRLAIEKESNLFDKVLKSVEEGLKRLENLLQELHVSSSSAGKEQLQAACSDLERIRKLKKEAEFLEASFRAKEAFLRQDRERVRTNNRQKQKFTHTVGSKSFARVAEAEELLSGQKVGHLQLFDITHRKKDGSLMTSEATEIMEKLKDKKAEYKAITLSDSSVHLDNIDNWIIIEVLGPERYGRVRFQGSFVNPTQYFGSSSQQYMPSGSQAQAEVQRLRDQMT